MRATMHPSFNEIAIPRDHRGRQALISIRIVLVVRVVVFIGVILVVRVNDVQRHGRGSDHVYSTNRVLATGIATSTSTSTRGGNLARRRVDHQTTAARPSPSPTSIDSSRRHSRARRALGQHGHIARPTCSRSITRRPAAGAVECTTEASDAAVVLPTNSATAATGATATSSSSSYEGAVHTHDGAGAARGGHDAPQLADALRDGHAPPAPIRLRQVVGRRVVNELRLLGLDNHIEVIVAHNVHKWMPPYRDFKPSFIGINSVFSNISNAVHHECVRAVYAPQLVLQVLVRDVFAPNGIEQHARAHQPQQVSSSEHAA
mmetsp:Transcript_15426/g.25701  ORF Transcript_15426/g.25701 Transcript_15426/m.25701 type:complete len:318 (+) Transcript_15426:235-1188(+)